MKPSQLFRDVRYLGEAEGDRKTYYVFETSTRYLVLGPSSGGGYYLNEVDKKGPERVTRRFRGKQVTTTLVKGMFQSSLAALNVLYVMVALRRARKLKKRRGRAMVFKMR
jgi:hypothetical protein